MSGKKYKLRKDYILFFKWGPLIFGVICICAGFFPSNVTGYTLEQNILLITWGFVFILISIVIISSLEIISYISKNISNRKKSKEKLHFDWKIKASGPNLENTIIEMVRMEGKVNLIKLSKQSKIDMAQLKLSIFELIGSGRLDGIIEEDYFIPKDTTKKEEIITTENQIISTQNVPFLPKSPTTQEISYYSRNVPVEKRKKKGLLFSDKLAIVVFIPFCVLFGLIPLLWYYYGDLSSYTPENYIIINWLFAIIFLFLGTASIILPRTILGIKERKAKLRKVVLSVDFKDVITGMIKSEGKLNLKQLSKRFGFQFDFLRLKMYGLIGSGKITGSFEGDYFIPGEDIIEHIDILLEEFAKWEKEKVDKLD